MFIPYDYQLDYLKALHTFYYAFPVPLRVSYYTLHNKQEISDATVITKSYYGHPLDDTSAALYDKIIQLPVYFTQQQDPRVNQATETGNLYQANEFSVVIPAIYGLQPEIDDFIVFTSTGTERLYRVSNIEVVNLFESSNLRAFKVTLVIDKHKDSSTIDQVTVDEFQFSFEFSRIFQSEKYKYVHDILLPLIMYDLLKLDQLTTQYEAIDYFLSKMYQDFKVYFNIAINKGEYQFIEVLKNYQEKDYTMLFEMPDIVFEIPDVADVTPIKSAVKSLNIPETTDYLPTFSEDYVNSDLQVQYESEISNDFMKRILVLYYGFKALKFEIEGV